MVDKKTWKEFRDSGLLWWINMILHTFGWAIVYNFEPYDKETGEGEITEIYPARVKFRGFDEANNTEGYQKISKYLKENIEMIEKESFE
jgi:hypothetical protein